MATNELHEDSARPFKNKRITRAKAIRLYCKEQCCLNDMKSWQECTISNCLLWRFRKGKELLGNQTSFTKTTAKLAVLKAQNAPEGEDEGDENDN